MKNTGVTFTPGRNLALKTPAHEFDALVDFYRDILGWQPIEHLLPNIVFEFADMRLWIDKVEHLSQAELWLEVECGDAALAAEYLAEKGIKRCDAIEPLPQGFSGFWIMSPGNMVHLLSETKP